MKFEFIQPKNRKIQSDELMKDLIRVAEKLGKSPTIAEYNENGKYEVTVFRRRFGSWNSALISANLSINNKEYSELELYANIEKIWIFLGKQPTRRDMDKKYSNISSGAYTRRFGTWINALQSFIAFINENDNDIGIIENDKILKSYHKTSRDVNDRLRFKVLKRDNFRCRFCGRSPANTLGLELHIDHIVPYSKGGETILDNLQTLCKDCNLGKSNL